MFGVLTTWLGDAFFSTAAKALAYLPQSSAKQNRMLRRFSSERTVR
jgi:hypothetical protein